MTNVYLAGPINGCTDAEATEWRTEVKRLLAFRGLTYSDPMDRDYRGTEDANVTEIVEKDKEEIHNSDAMIAYCPRPSVGTSMEVFYAFQLGRRVIVVAPGAVSPWLRYHSDRIVRSATVAAWLV